jgi:hypothetical protein
MGNKSLDLSDTCIGASPQRLNRQGVGQHSSARRARRAARFGPVVRTMALPTEARRVNRVALNPEPASGGDLRQDGANFGARSR